MSDITVHRAYVEQSNYLLYYTSVVSGIIKNGLNPKAVNTMSVTGVTHFECVELVHGKQGSDLAGLEALFLAYSTLNIQIFFKFICRVCIGIGTLIKPPGLWLFGIHWFCPKYCS